MHIDAATMIRTETNAINQLLRQHNVGAAVTTDGALVIRSSFVGYPLQLSDGQKLSRVEQLLREIGNKLFTVRAQMWPGYRQPTHVRLAQFPFALEAPYPDPRPLPAAQATIRAPRFHALLGRSYAYGLEPQEQYLDLTHDHHVLFAAMSGAGKSTLMRMALLTLLANTPPADLQVVVVDLKNDDFPAFRVMPQVIQFAGDMATAAASVAWVDGEMQRRVESGQRTPRLLLLIDELAQMRGDKASMARLLNIMNMGRALNINTWAGTQYPNKETITAEINTGFTTRIVGRVDGPTASSVATKRAGAGAHLLAVPGDFLRVDTEMRRIKAYNLSKTETAEQIAFWRQRWSAQRPAPLLIENAATPLPEPVDPRVAEIAAIIEPLIADGVSQNEMIRAVFGIGANTGGSNLAWIKRARAHLESTTTAATPERAASEITAKPSAARSSSSSERVWLS